MTVEIPIEILTAQELAERLKVQSSWVIDASQPGRTSDPIPVVKLGRHNRYAWNSKSMTACEGVYEMKGYSLQKHHGGWQVRRSGRSWPPLKEPVTHHALGEQKKNNRQDDCKQEMRNSKRRWLSF